MLETMTLEKEEQNAIVVPEFSLEKQKNEVALRVQNSPDIPNIVRQIDLKDANSIVSFGRSTSEEISRFSDQILHSMEMTKVEDSGEMLGRLNKIMDKFDIKDFEKNHGFLGRFFNKAKNSIDALFARYHTMGDEVDKVFVSLKQYEAEINRANQTLEQMFDKNLSYYETLEKYVYAGELAIDELKNKVIPQYQQKASESGDRVDQVNLNQLVQMQEMLEQRVYDLRLAENIAIQSMPMLNSIQKGNYELVRKINSAFIITIPIFKRCLTEAIILKRQAIQAKAVASLDEKTKELLLRNAENVALQSKMTAQLASGSFVDVETLEKTWQTIVQGIQDTRQIQEENRRKRIEGTDRLLKMQEDYKTKNVMDI